MKIHIADLNDKGNPAVTSAEILFDDNSPLKGMKLTGIMILRLASGDLSVILPDNLRTVIHPASERVMSGKGFTVSGRVVQAVEEEILDAYRKALTET